MFFVYGNDKPLAVVLVRLGEVRFGITATRIGGIHSRTWVERRNFAFSNEYFCKSGAVGEVIKSQSAPRATVRIKFPKKCHSRGETFENQLRKKKSAPVSSICIRYE